MAKSVTNVSLPTNPQRVSFPPPTNLKYEFLAIDADFGTSVYGAFCGVFGEKNAIAGSRGRQNAVALGIECINAVFSAEFDDRK